jgi:hypothetical protein
MPNNREWAMLAWLIIFLAGLALTNKKTRPGLPKLLRMSRKPALAIPLLLLLGWMSLELYLSHRIGLWRPDLTTDFIMWILVSGMVIFFNFEKASKQRHFIRKGATKTLGIAEIIQFFTNLFVLDLWLELIFIPTITFIVILSTVAERNPQHAQLRRLLQNILTLLGVALLAFSVQQLIANWGIADWPAIGRKFLLPIFLTVALLPFVYIVSLYAAYESAFKRANWSCPAGKIPIIVKIAIATTLHFRARLIGALKSPWINRLSTTTTFADSRRLTKDFRREFEASERAILDENIRLRHFAGSQGTDLNGRRLDRREFSETIRSLQMIADCQMGWYRNDNQHERYRTDLTEILGSSLFSGGSPEDPGITVKVSKNGQSWYAWRRTVSGWCFAIGSAGPPPDQWKYDGPEPPTGYPSEHTNWVNASTSNSDSAINWTTEPLLLDRNPQR